MKRNEVLKLLENHEDLAIPLVCENINHTGYLRFFKTKFNKNFYEKYKDNEKKQNWATRELKNLNFPYLINIVVVKTEIIYNDKWPCEEDYIVNKAYRFANLEKAEKFLLNRHNKRIEEAKLYSEVPHI